MGLSHKTIQDTLKNTPHFLRDAWVIFDLTIILISVVDNVILEFANLDFDASTISVLRVFRLFRLMRLVRLFKMLRELWLLVMGMVISIRTLFWAVLMLTLVIYVGAIMMVELVGKSATFEGDLDVENRWGNI